jgi:hypothetical protein
MLVYAVPMRRRGKKLSKEVVQLAQPVRGYLTLQPSLTLRTNEPCLSAWVTEGTDPTTKNLLPPMERALVRRASVFQMVIVGSERIDKGRKDCDWYPQAWWCRLPGLHR